MQHKHSRIKLILLIIGGKKDNYDNYDNFHYAILQ